jgi:NADPH:quinone reductase-like Zn-dependent oxidoreductase
LLALRYHSFGDLHDLQLEEVPAQCVQRMPDALTFQDAAALACAGATAVDEYLGYLAQGRLRPSIEQVFPLHEARPAIERSRAGHVQGKIVLQVD